MLGGGGKSSCTLSKMLVLDTVPIHEVSLANQHFYSTLLGRREGVCQKSTLCTLVKMLKIIDGPLLKITYKLSYNFTKRTPN